MFDIGFIGISYLDVIASFHSLSSLIFIDFHRFNLNSDATRKGIKYLLRSLRVGMSRVS